MLLEATPVFFVRISPALVGWGETQARVPLCETRRRAATTVGDGMTQRHNLVQGVIALTEAPAALISPASRGRCSLLLERTAEGKFTCRRDTLCWSGVGRRGYI
jgi:hypothetical protein